MPNKMQKSGEAGKVGIIQIKSQGEPNQRTEQDNQEFELLEKIYRAKASGNREEAIKLIDSLIEIYKASNRPTFEFQVEKVLIREPTHFEALIPIYEDQLNFYKRGNNLIEQINTLLSLSAVSVNSDQFPLAKTYIERAEQLLINIQANDTRKNEEANDDLDFAKLEELRNRTKQAKSYIISRLENR